MKINTGMLVALFTGILLAQWAMLNCQHGIAMARVMQNNRVTTPPVILSTPLPAPVLEKQHFPDAAGETDKLRRLVKLQERTMERILAASQARMETQKKRYVTLQEQHERLRTERDALKKKLAKLVARTD